jgi:hypothetical protein
MPWCGSPTSQPRQSPPSPNASARLGSAAPADLVDHAGDRDVVVDQPVALDAAPRHAEQRHALDASRRAGDARQREVHDVVGEIVVAAGDEDLGAAQQVVPVGGGRRDGGDVGQARPGLRLGQRHRAGPLAAVHPRHVGRAQVGVAERLDQVGRALGQAEVAVGAGVGGHQVRGGQREHRQRQLLAADLDRPRRGDQVEVAQLAKQRVELRVDHDPAVDQPRRLLVEGAVRGVERRAGQAAGGVDRGEERRAVVLGEVRQRGERRQVEHLVEQERDVAIVEQRVVAHAGSVGGGGAPRRGRCPKIAQPAAMTTLVLPGGLLVR